MRKLNITEYMVTIRAPDKMNPGKVIEGEWPYQTKETILNLLFNKELRLSNADVVRANALALKLEACKDDEILLEDEEFVRIKKAFDVFKGFNRNDVELIRRIDEAETVEVEAKNK